MAKDRILCAVGDWSISTDGIQWILSRKGHALSFVRSTKEILARCMRENRCLPETAARLLEGLPETFGAAGSDYSAEAAHRPRRQTTLSAALK